MATLDKLMKAFESLKSFQQQQPLPPQPSQPQPPQSPQPQPPPPPPPPGPAAAEEPLHRPKKELSATKKDRVNHCLTICENIVAQSLSFHVPVLGPLLLFVRPGGVSCCSWRLLLLLVCTLDSWGHVQLIGGLLLVLIFLLG